MVNIHLVLTDDWELCGDGSGNMRRIQFDTMRQLVNLYDRFSFKGSFNVEVMQQLYHLRYGRDYPVLLELAEEWEALVKEIYARGHDVQLHVHPQWHKAHYENGQWYLNKRWSILDYAYEDVLHILTTCKQYLEALLQPLQIHYRCVAYRSGSWFLAPSEHVLPILANLGVICDMSIVRGLYFDLEMGALDYREIDEPFLPFYPQMHDARRVAASVQPIVCVPTHSVRWGPASALLNIVKKTITKAPSWSLPESLRTYLLPPNATPISGSGIAQNYYQEQWGSNTSRGDWMRKLTAFLTSRADRVSDLSALSYLEMRAIIQDIRRRANASRWPIVPVILENHTKNIGDFRPLERFCSYLSHAPDVAVITTRDLVANIRAGMYPIRRGEGTR